MQISVRRFSQIADHARDDATNNVTLERQIDWCQLIRIQTVKRPQCATHFNSVSGIAQLPVDLTLLILTLTWQNIDQRIGPDFPPICLNARSKSEGAVYHRNSTDGKR